MGTRLIINGREVSNPAAKALATLVVMFVVALVLSLLLFVALPLLGVAVGLGLGIGAVAAGSLAAGAPLLRRRIVEGRELPPAERLRLGEGDREKES